MKRRIKSYIIFIVYLTECTSVCTAALFTYFRGFIANRRNLQETPFGIRSTAGVSCCLFGDMNGDCHSHLHLYYMRPEGKSQAGSGKSCKRRMPIEREIQSFFIICLTTGAGCSILHSNRTNIHTKWVCAKWEEHHERANVLTDKNDITLRK